ncbi:MAG: hypothetical protein CVT76_01215 [Alphaproteobacteria bacterium HGW-Alphaproteobacteria-15]|nr:MAG: hypothetical protein CVT76_01215 [Alphaproteobacteria bacterium HGW-Alphaproteobacteria-15]
MRTRSGPEALPSSCQRLRLAQLLMIHDALAEGASARDIAFVVKSFRTMPFSSAQCGRAQANAGTRCG